MDLLDFSIALVILLFILSIMTEKLVQLTKDYSLLFNIFTLAVSFMLLVRGTWLAFNWGENQEEVRLWSVLCIISQILFYVFFKEIRKNSLRMTPFLFAIVLFNIVVSFFFDHSLYFTCSFVLGYMSLTSLGVIPESDFFFAGRNINTRFFKRIAKKDGVIEDAPKREKEISALSIVVGVIVAYLFKADFFTIISNLGQGDEETLRDAMTWNPFPFSWVNGWFAYEGFNFQAELAFGLLLTGFFLSFGSKFFHDLLETLFYAKKAREAIADQRTYEKTSADGVRDWVNSYDLQNFYYKEKAALLGQPEVSAIGIGSIQKDGNWIPGIRVYTDSALPDLDSRFLYENASNCLYKVPYEIIVSTERSTPSLSSISGLGEVCNALQPNLTGALTYPVTVKKDHVELSGPYLMSCYHVVKHVQHRWDGVNSDFNKVSVSEEGIIGEIIAGARSIYAEASLIKVDPDRKIDDPFFPGMDIRIRGERIINKDDVGRRVIMYSRKKGRKAEGIIRSYDFADTIYYDPRREPHGFKMHRLIEVQAKESGSIQYDGDSGSLLFDEYDYAIGIVFAKRGGRYTLAMRIDQAFSLLKTYGYDVNLKVNIS